jgi:hypothetical protein
MVDYEPSLQHRHDGNLAKERARYMELVKQENIFDKDLSFYDNLTRLIVQTRLDQKAVYHTFSETLSQILDWRAESLSRDTRTEEHDLSWWRNLINTFNRPRVDLVKWVTMHQVRFHPNCISVVRFAREKNQYIDTLRDLCQPEDYVLDEEAFDAALTKAHEEYTNSPDVRVKALKEARQRVIPPGSVQDHTELITFKFLAGVCFFFEMHMSTVVWTTLERLRNSPRAYFSEFDELGDVTTMRSRPDGQGADALSDRDHSVARRTDPIGGAYVPSVYAQGRQGARGVLMSVILALVLGYAST